jgi:hypothetical protein
MYTKNLAGNVPLYGQQQCTWCGAACGQMARNGYPNPPDRLFYQQVDVWNAIQVRNSTAAADANWATDPHGLTATLQDLNNPAGVHWVEIADATMNSILFDILYWMNRLEYPAPVLINKGGHWVNIVGFVTDVAPIGGSNPVLQSITVNDPEPHNVGTVSTFSGAQWSSGPWNGAVQYSGTWKGKYVAVIEPPIERGIVRVEELTRMGRELLSPGEAVERARKAIADLDLEQTSQHAILGRSDIRAFEPLLVREEPPTQRSRKSVPHYYVVPFGLEADSETPGSGAVRSSLLVNAYTGAVEEITTFGSPIRYLQEEEAIEIVVSALRAGPERRSVDATLMFAPGDITHVRTYPFWRIKFGQRTVFVDQLGKIYGKFLPSIPGD